MENLLISACLAGYACKYSGGSNALSGDVLEKLRENYRLIPVCPESAGGLPTPRDPSERTGRRVVSCHGRDVTEEYRRGAAAAVTLAKKYGCKFALMKENSPSCGSGRIYDGSFSGTLTDGDGVTAEELKKNGVTVLGESRVQELFRE